MFERFFKIHPRPVMIAHRGARKVAPENTLLAFKKAVKMGFDGVEMDVVLTRDKVPVVFHGDDLSHSTRETGLISQTLSFDLKKIDAGSLFGDNFKGEPIPTLAEVLALLKDTDLFIDLEIKSQGKGQKHRGIEKIVAEMIYYYQIHDRMIVSSFSPLILRRFSRIAPKIPTAFLVGPRPFLFLKTLLFADMLKISAVNPVFQHTPASLVRFARMRGWKVFPWAVNTRQEYMRALELGVDGIITDEPELLKVRT